MFRINKKLFLIPMIGVLLTSILVGLASSVQALNYIPDTSFSWVDKATISARNPAETRNFVDSNPNDSTREFIFKDACGTHKLRIVSGDNVAQLTFSTSAPSGSLLLEDTNSSGCGSIITTPSNIDVKNPENATKNPTPGGSTSTGNSANNPYTKAIFSWKNAGVINSVDPTIPFESKDGITFTATTPSKSGEKCFDQINNISADKSTGRIVVRVNQLTSGGEVCAEAATATISFVNVANQKLPSTVAGGEEADGNDCGDAGFVLGWIICPIGSAMAEITQGVDGVLYSLLYINTDTWEASGVKSAWENMRTIASVLIVLVALVGIASQVFNFDFISAYTIRKVLPKLFIAVILIQLSWFLAIMAINISNTVGFSVQSLISAPFEAVAEQFSNDNNGAAVTIDTGGDGWIGFADVLTVYANNSSNPDLNGALLVGGAATAGILMSGGVILALAGGFISVGAVMMYLIALLIPVVLALLASFVVVFLRIILIIGLTVVLPLALVAWILPNTSKWFDRWWAIFFSLLAMFPIIIAFVTFGKVASLLIATSGGTNQLITLTGVIIAYFLPYFLIFKFIKFSNGALGKIQGAIDNVSGKAREVGPLKSFGDRAKENIKVGKSDRAQQNLADANALLNKNKSETTALDRMRARSSRTLARSTLGQLGTSGRLSRKATDESFDSIGKEKSAELQSFMRDFSPEQQTKFLESLRDHDPNSGPLEFEGKKIKVDGGLKAAAIPKMMDFKINPDNVYNEAQAQGGYYQAAVRRVLADNGGLVDQRITDISRSGTVITDYVNGTGASQAVRTKQATYYADLDDDRKTRVRTAIATLSNGTVEQQEEAAGLLNMLARNGNLAQPDYEKLSSELGIDFGSVASSGGNLRFARGASGKIEIKRTSDIGNTTATATSPPKIVYVQQPASPGGSPLALTPTEVNIQITDAGGIAALSPQELIDLMNHANKEWNDPLGVQMGIEAQEELRRRGVLPPR